MSEIDKLSDRADALDAGGGDEPEPERLVYEDEETGRWYDLDGEPVDPASPAVDPIVIIEVAPDDLPGGSA